MQMYKSYNNRAIPVNEYSVSLFIGIYNIIFADHEFTNSFFITNTGVRIDLNNLTASTVIRETSDLMTFQRVDSDLVTIFN